MQLDLAGNKTSKHKLEQMKTIKNNSKTKQKPASITKYARLIGQLGGRPPKSGNN